MNLDTYFARLGIAAPAKADAENLRRIHVAHLAAFPFHNVEIQQHGSPRVDLPSIEMKFSAPRSGGYCFEHNTLLAAALREVGYEVEILLGRAGPPQSRWLNHMLLKVRADGGAWLADVGFGAEGPLEPIPLVDGARTLEDGIEYELRQEGELWTLTLHCSDRTEELYEFGTARHTIGDVAMANFFVAEHPASVFRRTLTIQRATREERLILRLTVVTRYRGGVRTDTTSTPAEVRGHARALFGIELGEAPLLFETLAPPSD